MLTIIEAIQGKNRCFARGRKITGICAPLVHDIGCCATHAGRFVECPKFLEGTGYTNKYKNYWNSPVPSKMVHAFIGLDANENIVVAQTLPLEFCCWGVGGGKNGSYNYPPTSSKPKQFAHIQFEICEDDKKNNDFYELSMNTAAEYCAWLIQNGYCSDTVDLIVCHRDAARAGFGSNHGDILDWAIEHNETEKTYMNSFRARVHKYLDAGKVEANKKYCSAMCTCKPSKYYSSTAWYLQSCLNRLGYTCGTDGILLNETLNQLKSFQKNVGLVADGICEKNTWDKIMEELNKNQPQITVVDNQDNTITLEKHYVGIVKTKNDGYISLWSTPDKKSRICKILDGESVEITGDNVSGTMSVGKYKNYSGYIDTQYIINKTNVI